MFNRNKEKKTDACPIPPGIDPQLNIFSMSVIDTRQGMRFNFKWLAGTIAFIFSVPMALMGLVVLMILTFIDQLPTFIEQLPDAELVYIFMHPYITYTMISMSFTAVTGLAIIALALRWRKTENFNWNQSRGLVYVFLLYGLAQLPILVRDLQVVALSSSSIVENLQKVMLFTACFYSAKSILNKRSILNKTVFMFWSLFFALNTLKLILVLVLNPSLMNISMISNMGSSICAVLFFTGNTVRRLNFQESTNIMSLRASLLFYSLFLLTPIEGIFRSPYLVNSTVILNTLLVMMVLIPGLSVLALSLYPWRLELKVE